MKCFQKVCVHDIVVVALNSDKEKYLNYETSNDRDLNGNIYVHCHDNEEANTFWVPKSFHRASGGCVRVRSPEITVLKQNANIKLLADAESQILGTAAGSMLPLGKSYHL